MSEILDVVNEHDEVIGQAERDEVHRAGLLCRLVYVCFYTASGDVILQKRSLTKKNDPGKLTTAVSGHVSSGQNYIEAAIRETLEETGLSLSEPNLISLGIVKAEYTQGNYVSNAMRGLFAYKFNGSAEDLLVEEGDGAGFVALSVEELGEQLSQEPEKFAKILSGQVGKDLIQKIKHLL